MLHQLFLVILAVILTIEQAFDVISTNLVLSKGRGHEGNGAIAWVMGKLGHWWWIVKLPVVAWLAYIAHANTEFYLGRIPAVAAGMVVLALVYAYVLWNNYKLAWRQ